VRGNAVQCSDVSCTKELAEQVKECEGQLQYDAWMYPAERKLLGRLKECLGHPQYNAGMYPAQRKLLGMLQAVRGNCSILYGVSCSQELAELVRL
jgi:hypothetical protein